MVPRSQETIASSREPLAELARHHLRLHRLVAARLARSSMSARHPPCPAGRVSRKRGPRLRREQRQQRLEGAPGIADEADLDRIAQADARGVEVDLDAARLAGLRVELDVRERRARPAAACRTPRATSCDGRGRRADPTGPVVYGLSSGTTALPRSAFTMGAPSRSAARCSRSSDAERSRPARMATLLAVVQQLGGPTEIRVGRADARSARRRRRCGRARCVASAGAGLHLLEVDGQSHVRDAVGRPARCDRRGRSRSRRGPGP